MSTIAPPHRGDPFFKQMFQAVSTTGGQFYIRMEDEIRLSVFTTTASLTVTLEGILLDLDGDAKPFNIIVNPTSDGVRTSKQVRVGPGFVLYCEPRLSGGTPAIGNTTVVVEVVQSDNATAPVVKQVAFGSLTATGFYPYQDIANTVTTSGTVSVSNNPTPQLISGTTPAAGAEFVMTVPASTVWVVKHVNFKFVASAAAANRIITLHVVSGTKDLGFYYGDTSWTAGQTALFSFGGSAPFFDSPAPGTAGFATSHMPELVLPAGATIGSNTVAIDVGDQYSSVAAGVLAYAV